MRVGVIAAMSRNRVIGREGGLPWHLPADLKAFKAATLGKPVIMGRRTWDSIGKALPGRLNIVVSRNPGFDAPGITACRSLDAALQAAAASGAGEVMIIGGASLYKQALPLAWEMLLTIVDADLEGDTFFPPYDASRWLETGREHRAADEQNEHAMDFVRLLAKRARP